MTVGQSFLSRLWATAALSAVIVVLALVTLAAGSEVPPEGEPEARKGWPHEFSMVIYRDPGTGCHWLVSGPFASAVPRLDVNKSQVCTDIAGNRLRPSGGQWAGSFEGELGEGVL